MALFRNKFFRRLGDKTHIPTVITMFILVSHISEISYAVEHITVWEVLTTIALFALWVAMGSGTEMLS